MARFTVATAVIAAVASPQPADAFRPVSGDRAERPMTADGIPLRTHRDVTWDQPPPAARAAWHAFRVQTGERDAWRASWDVATQVPSRILGAGISSPGSVDSAAAAEDAARRVLAQHIDLLAPGGDPAEFVVVSNHREGDLRSVGLAQHHDGLRVVGGQVSFRFRNDRLFVIGSEALPHVDVGRAGPMLPAAAARRSAADVTRARSPGAGDILTGRVEGPVIFPLVGEKGVHGYRRAMRVDVEGSAPGHRWNVYVDATTGDLLARERRAHPTSSTVHFDVPLRRPSGGRDSFPARRARVVIDGRSAETGDDGAVVWIGDNTADITLRPEGSFVELQNVAGPLGELATVITSGTPLVWDASDDELVDAQLSAFTHTQIAADHARDITGTSPWLSDEVDVNVNIDSACNAFFDQNSKSINFFQSSEECENTARLADVIYHEFGHLLHVQSIIEGVGRFDGAFSEGAADYFAAIITGDPGVGRGFFHDNRPLRHIAPNDEPPRTWPDDIADIHTTGLIFAGAMWRLREELVEEHGPEQGAAIADHLYYAALRRATDIPSSYVEVLVADDDDGDLSSGTPNICAINRAFGPHGLRAIRTEIDDLGADTVSEDGHEVGFRAYGIYDQCESDRVESAEIVWRKRGGAVEHRVTMSPDGDGFTGAIPPQTRNTPLRYRFEITFADGGTRHIPNNPADPELDLYVGETIPLYCTDFEGVHPFREGGWTRGALHGTNDWEWGEPVGDADDPPLAYAGRNVIGNDLGGMDADGSYAPDSVNFVKSPVINVGDFTNVRLQYRRWLNVADGHFDTASILANDEVLWRNETHNEGLRSNLHHRDEMWRFHDVPLVPVMGSDTVQITFQLDSTGDFAFGGWNIDAFCVVADPDSVCGDGVITGFEACDDGDGNSDVLPDACRTSCLPAHCGDGVVNSGEECDPASGDGACRENCTKAGSSGGCGCVAGGAGGPLAGPLLLTVVGALALLRLRRRYSLRCAISGGEAKKRLRSGSLYRA